MQSLAHVELSPPQIPQASRMTARPPAHGKTGAAEPIASERLESGSGEAVLLRTDCAVGIAETAAVVGGAVGVGDG
jgi:hypothetical protein